MAEFKYIIDLADGRVSRHDAPANDDGLFQYANTIEECKELLRSEGENFISLGKEFKEMAKKLKASDVE